MAGQAVYDMFLTNMPGMKPAAVETEGSQEDVAVKLKWLPTADELLHAEEAAPADDGKANGAEVWASLLTSAARPLKRQLSQLALENSLPPAIMSCASCQNGKDGGCQLALHDVEKEIPNKADEKIDMEIKEKIDWKIPEKEDEKMEVKIPEKEDEKMEVEIKEEAEKIEVKIPEKEDEKMEVEIKEDAEKIEVKIPEKEDEKMEVEIKEEAEKIQVKIAKKEDEKMEVEIKEEAEKIEVKIPEKEDAKMEVEIKEEAEKIQVKIPEKEDEKTEVEMKEDTPEEIAEPPLKKRRVKKTFAQRYQPQSDDAGLRWQVIRDVFVKELQPIIKTPASFEDSFYKQCQTAFKSKGAQDSVTLVAVATEQCALWMESHPEVKK